MYISVLCFEFISNKQVPSFLPKGARRTFNMAYQTNAFLVGPLSGQRSIDEMLHRKSLTFVYSVMNSNNSIVAHIGQLIRQTAKSPIGGNVACFRYKFGIDVDDNVLNNLRLISRYVELNGERNISASIAIDLQSMIEDNHVGFTRDELSYMLNNVYILIISDPEGPMIRR